MCHQGLHFLGGWWGRREGERFFNHRHLLHYGDARVLAKMYKYARVLSKVSVRLALYSGTGTDSLTVHHHLDHGVLHARPRLQVAVAHQALFALPGGSVLHAQLHELEHHLLVRGQPHLLLALGRHAQGLKQPKWSRAKRLSPANSKSRALRTGGGGGVRRMWGVGLGGEGWLGGGVAEVMGMSGGVYPGGFMDA